jgi:type II secretory pathway pseudopilin PulG
MKISGQGGAAPPQRRELDDRGYILVVLLIAMAVAAVWIGAALPAWRQQAMREKELELIFRGEQYARAIALYQIKNNSYPLDIDVLVSQRYLRKKWKDPVTGDDFQLVGLTGGQGGTPNRSGVPGGAPGIGSRGGSPVGPGGATQIPGAPGRGSAQPSIGGGPLIGGVTGVRSVSAATSIRVYNGQQQHNLWQFDAAMMMARMGRNQAPAGQGRGDGRGGPGTRPGGPGPGGGPGRGLGPGGAGPGRGPGAGRGGPPPPPPPPGGGPGRGAGS